MPSGVSVTTVALPATALSYDQLVTFVALPESNRLVLLAESFSGPLAVRLAQEHRVDAIVFCNSFIAPPGSSALGMLVTSLIFRFRIPRLLLRHFLVGNAGSPHLLQLVANTIASVPPSVLAARLRLVLNTDVSALFSTLQVPVLYLRGTEDRLVPDSSWQYMAALRPVTLARLAGPHLLLQTHPEEVWNSISHFLGSVPER
jgi:pimeloyl-ACP methyl ester carboxylesterase